MPFKKGYDPNKFDLAKWRAERAAARVSQNPSTAGVPIVRMDDAAIARHQRLKDPAANNPFASTGGWGGTKGEVWGTFKGVAQPTNEWDSKPKVTITPSEPW